MKQIGYHWAEFHKIILRLRIFRKSTDKIHISLKPGKNDGYTLHEYQYTFLLYLAQFFVK